MQIKKRYLFLTATVGGIVTAIYIIHLQQQKEQLYYYEEPISPVEFEDMWTPMSFKS